jgi:hypothetical protein
MDRVFMVIDKIDEFANHNSGRDLNLLATDTRMHLLQIVL